MLSDQDEGLFNSLELYFGEASNYQCRMKHKFVLVFSVFVLVIIANGLGSVAIVDWSDVERIAVYDEYATLGSTVTIEYYIVNDRPVDVKVENIPWFSTRILWSLESNPVQKTPSGPTLKYLSIPAKDRMSCDSVTIYIKKMGYVVVQKTGFPDVRIDVIEEFETQFNVTIGLNEYVFESQDTAQLIITNRDSHEITFGSPYIIKKWVDGEWVKASPFPPNSAWGMAIQILHAGGTSTQEIKIDTLESGHYRISKTINHERTQTELTFTLEFDIHSQAQWEKIFGGTGTEFSSSVQITDDGGYTIIGNSNSFDLVGKGVYFIKTNSRGNVMWEKNVGEGVGGSVYSSQVASDGGYIIAGSTSIRLGEKAVYLLKTDSNGVLEWENIFNGTGSSGGWSVQVATDGGYIIAGYSKGTFAEGGNNVYLVKTDSRGELEWEKFFGGSFSDRGRSVQVTSDGGYIIAGETQSFGAGKFDVYLIKTNSNGELEWNKTYGGPENDIGWSVQVTSDSGYIITGITDSYGFGGSDVYLVKTDSNGDLKWEGAFGRAGYDRGYCVQVTDDGGYIISGLVTSSNFSPQHDVYLVKTDSNGNLEWEKTFGGPDHDAGWCVQVTSDGGYILTGSTSRYWITRKEDILLIKFKPE
jgi:hypothetical protein